MRKRKTWKKGLTAVLTGGLLLQTAGCSAGSVDTSSETSQESSAEETGQEETTGQAGTAAETEMADEAGAGGLTAEYDEDDLDAAWSEESAQTITCSGTDVQGGDQGGSIEDGVIRITQAGTYILRGSYEGQICIEAGEEDTVRLVLDGFAVSCSDTSPIYGLQCKKLILTLAEGTENQVSDGSSYVFENPDDDEPDAAIFCKGDLTVNGSGSLTVNGNYSDGIRSKEDLKIISGQIQVTAVKDGLKGKDSLTMKDGQIQITSGEDGLKANNDSDPDKGYLIIDGGQIQISAGDDGIHSETWLTIHDGTITVEESNEGIEGMKIDINGGSISVSSEDDGINAAASTGDETVDSERQKMEANPDVYVRIAGGEISISPGADGIDSNGDVYVTGGATYISGPETGGEGSLDYNGTAYISGGVFAAAGSAGMAQPFSEDSEQAMLMVYYEESLEAGTAITLTDQSGNEVFSWSPEKSYGCLLLSMPELEDGASYTLTTGETSQEVTIDGTVTQIGEGGLGGAGGRGPGGGRGQMRGEAPQDGETPPEGENQPSEGENPPDRGGMPQREDSGNMRQQERAPSEENEAGSIGSEEETA